MITTTLGVVLIFPFQKEENTVGNGFNVWWLLHSTTPPQALSCVVNLVCPVSNYNEFFSVFVMLLCFVLSCFNLHVDLLCRKVEGKKGKRISIQKKNIL